MKLLRGICECGFITRKARVGYHFHKWWFPIFSVASGELTDVTVSLHENDVRRIQLSKADAEEIHVPFIEAAKQRLVSQFANRFDVMFNPKNAATSPCPQCRYDKLIIVAVPVSAKCKADCGYEYSWHDSQEQGCPRCSHRPHRFRVDLEPQLSRQTRITTHCPCSSSMESVSHLDAYCPKCGELPVSYQIVERWFCGVHHTELQPYQMPGNFLFAEPAARWSSHEFPNAKLWGDSETNDSIASSYCVECENDHQRWLHTNDDA